ncbi:gephyrin-like molybdotransferase Glp [Brevibacillus sp. B_LB10_24]|uniref:molybdopterin molybdotransferase MoeA n=1 Tax=Brevibacillus sp. B_LB10_24 TaxID=3380645 RepID=UPI0038BCD763
MRFHRETVTVEEAVRRLLAGAAPIGIEEVPLAEAHGRILAQDCRADCALPSFDRASLDGYAVRAADTAGAAPQSPVRLRVAGCLKAGDVPAGPIKRGEAVRIMTGAMMPAGADAVVMFEQTENPGEWLDAVLIKRELEPGENVAYKGQEITSGEMVLAAGEQIGGGALAVLATFGMTPVPVYQKPRIGILSIGDELVDPAQPPSPGKIRDSNTIMLWGLIHESGGIPLVCQRLPDDLETAKAEIDQVLGQVDLLVTTGGVSVGDKDIVASLVDEPDVELLFNRVAMRPGSPTTAIRQSGRLICALSGNPGACFTGFHLLVRPLLARLAGRREASPMRSEKALLICDYHKPCPYPRYLRGRLQLQETTLYAIPDGFDKSGMLRTLKDAECLIVIPPGGRGRSAGEVVEIIPFRK